MNRERLTIRQRAEAIANDDGACESSWSSNHTSCGYECCGGGRAKEIDRKALADAIESLVEALLAESPQEAASIDDAKVLTEAILARLSKTASGRMVAFDKLHVLEVILEWQQPPLPTPPG